jgi:hypothetical protein
LSHQKIPSFPSAAPGNSGGSLPSSGGFVPSSFPWARQKVAGAAQRGSLPGLGCLLGLVLAFLAIGGPLGGALRAGEPASPAGEAPEAAGDTSDIVKLEQFTVSDNELDSSVVPDRQVTALYGYATPFQDIPRSIAEITPDQFDHDVINSVDDFARYSPAVSLLTGQADNAGTPYFRGSQGDLYQNGVRLLTRGTNNRPFTLNPYEAADLVAGPASVIFGPSARTAGYVNYITKQPYFDHPQGELTVNIGQWFDGAGDKLEGSAQVDVGAPIIPGKLAFRVSYEAATDDSYYENTRDRYNNIFGALGWRPNGTTAIDVNMEYGHYDWIVDNFQNRVTNALIRDSTYLAGPATPIIQVGSKYFSPVLTETGAPSGDWITRLKSAGANGLTYYAAGTPAANPTSDSAAGAGTIAGYVLDPALVHPIQIGESAALNAPGYPSLTDTINFQTRFKKEVNSNFVLVNSLTYGRYHTDTSSNGGFYNYILADSIEDRVEAQLQFAYRLWGLSIEHQSNTGLAYRWEPSTNFKDTQNTGYGPTGDYYNLAGNPLDWTRNAFFGAPVYPFLGLATTPVLTNFGYLKGFWQYLPVPQSDIGGATTPGGSASGTAVGTLGTADYHTLDQWGSVFTQHTLKLGSHLLLDLGLRESLVWANLSNPLPSPNVPGNGAIGGSVRVPEPSESASLSYKPVPWVTAYVTYDRVTAVNGNTSGVAAWSTTIAGVPNQLDPYNFKSVSELHEAGIKTELIPNKLVVTVDAFRQTRALTLALPAGAANAANPIQAVGLYDGEEFSLRYQVSRDFSLGANYSYLEATNLDSTYSAPAPIVADNDTNILGATTSVKGVNYRVVNLPHNTGSLFASYQWRSGLGLRADYSVHDQYNVATDGSVTVPGDYTVDVSVFYATRRYRIAFNVQNLTNQHDHAGGPTPLAPLNAGLRVAYRF